MGLNQIIKVGNNIKKLRKKSGLTQKDMSELLNIPCSTYSNYENNNREPKREILIKISEIFDVDLKVLLSLDMNEDFVKKRNSVIPYDTKSIEKTEIIEKLIKLCGYNISFNKLYDSDIAVNQYLQEQIKLNLIPLVYISGDGADINLTDSQFSDLAEKILQLVQFEVNELFLKKCI